MCVPDYHFIDRLSFADTLLSIRGQHKTRVFLHDCRFGSLASVNLPRGSLGDILNLFFLWRSASR